jgi:hypothetical protein
MAVPPELKPNPDPSLLTTENLRREIGTLREMFEIEIRALEKRFQDANVLYKERFEAADLRYQQRYDASDKALMAASLAAKEAVNAALAAAKEAVLAASISAEKAIAAQNESTGASILKSELSVTKQIDSIQTALGTSNKTLDDKIAVLNSRLDRGDGIIRGGGDMRSERRLDTGVIVAIVAVVLSSASIVATIAALVLRHS